jgi:hypothetical protein
MCKTKNKVHKGAYLECGAYDPCYVTRAVRNLIYERYKQTVPDKFLDELFEIIEQGEEK